MINNMMTVNEAAKLSGVSVRTLQYYDKIGLLSPAAMTEAGYRLYNSDSMERLQQILLFRELEFPLKEIKMILESKDFDRDKALEQQIELLTLRKEHLEELIAYAERLRAERDDTDFEAFSKEKLEEYSRLAKEKWGCTEQYAEYEEKSAEKSEDLKMMQAEDLMKIFKEFGTMKDLAPLDDKVQAQVRKLRDFISENYYNCTDEILLSLSKMYAAGGEFTKNIDGAGGKGTADFVYQAVTVYVILERMEKFLNSTDDEEKEEKSKNSEQFQEAELERIFKKLGIT